MPLTAVRPSRPAPSVSSCVASAQTLTDQAACWADHVLATAGVDGSPALPAAYVTRKALSAVAFSLRHGLRDLAVPTKLVGVKAHQHAVEALVLYDQLPVHRRPRLAVTEGTEGVLAVSAVRSDGSLQPVGRLQPKHVAWVSSLLGDGGRLEGRPGVAVHLHAVTGLGRRARGLPVTLGVNVRLSGLGGALGSPPSPALRAVAEPAASYRPAPGRTESAPAVRLWRGADGVARMSCPHVVRHSPSGPEWGYGGSGPADCARSVLLALAGEVLADSHYQAFKADVIARVPEDGAVITRAAVLAWASGRADRGAATPARRVA